MKKVLIIEDHSDMRELLMWQIELMGFMPITAKRGKEGVELALSEKPELIIMDIMMPLLDGNKKAKILKQQTHSQDIPIMFISSKPEEELVALVAESGVDGYICKPFSPQGIVNSVRAALKG